MTRTIIAAGAALLAFASPAFADDGERTFTHQGVTYTYTVATKGTAKVLKGSADEGANFRLTVKNGWVDGYVGQAWVSFPAHKGKPVTVAQR